MARRKKGHHSIAERLRLLSFYAWKDYSDSIATFGFILLASMLALALAPEQETSETIPDFWFDELGATPQSPYVEPQSRSSTKELELDLPFEQEAETPTGQATSEAGPEQPDQAAKTTEPEPDPWQQYKIKRNDTLGAILHRITDDEPAISYLVTQKMNSYRKLRRGKDIEYQIGTDGKLISLRYKASPDLYLEFTQDTSGNLNVIEGAPDLTASVVTKSARITQDNNSLFAASDAADVPDRVIQSVIDALETRIDFERDTRLNDSFSVIYERLRDLDGDEAGTGKLIALRFVNQGKEITGLLHEEDGGYYEPNGESLQKAFLRSPLKFSRISSRYTNRRFHPVLKKWRSHRGVDFAAPTNTPIRASGDGTVEFVGRKGGYGNTVMIRHYDKYVTLYGHLNKYAKGVRKGTRVAQGQVIGYVGSTGLATGPHLHYEFRVNGEFKDPLSTAVPTRKPDLAGEALANFQSVNKKWLAELDKATGAGAPVDIAQTN